MYYPKSQIRTNLYTSGNEYALIDSPQVSYSGYYYEISTGKLYTGKTPEDGGNILLIPIKWMGDDGVEDNLDTLPQLKPLLIQSDYPHKLPPTLTLPPSRFLPPYNSPKPTEKDYSIGEFQRYFCKKTNELIYVETDKDTFKKLLNADPKIAFDLYIPIETPWTIKGTKELVYNVNKKIITLIERNQKWYGFTKYFKDRFLQYHISELNENLYTVGKEYTLPDGSFYVGWYHKMNTGVIMTGKEHGTGDDIILTFVGTPLPIPQTSTTSPPTPTGGSGY